MTEDTSGIAAMRTAYSRTIEPFLEDLEADRARLARLMMRDAKFLAIAGGLGALVLLPFSGPDQNLWLIPPLVAVILGASLVYRRQGQWQRAVSGMALEGLASFVPGLTYRLELKDAQFVAPFEEAGLVGNSSRKRLRFHLKGQYGGRAFECLHAILGRSGGSQGSGHTVFHGMLARIDLPMPSPIQVVVIPKPGSLTSKYPGLFRNPRLNRMKEVKVAGPISERYVVRADCQTDADDERVQALLRPELQEALVDIDTHEAHGGASTAFAQLHAAFRGGVLFLALARNQVSKVGGIEVLRPKSYMKVPFFLSQNPDLAATFSEMFEDALLVFRLIDRLNAPEGMARAQEGLAS